MCAIHINWVCELDNITNLEFVWVVVVCRFWCRCWRWCWWWVPRLVTKCTSERRFGNVHDIERWAACWIGWRTTLVLPENTHIRTVPAVEEADMIWTHTHDITNTQVVCVVYQIELVIFVHVTLQVPTTDCKTVASPQGQAHLLPEQRRSVPALPAVCIVYIEAQSENVRLEVRIRVIWHVIDIAETAFFFSVVFKFQMLFAVIIWHKFVEFV